MVLTFKNAKNNSILPITEFVGGNAIQFVRVDLTIAAVKGCEEVKKVLEKCEDFKGKVLEVVEDTLNAKIFVKFTMEHTNFKDKYSEDTGEYVETIETKEDYNYLLIINKVDR